MQITFYGTGSCMPAPKTSKNPFRSHTGWYVEIGDDSLLFDIGSGLLQKMLLDGKDILKKPTHLFISHFHPDHCSDLIALMQGRGVANVWGDKLLPLFIGGPEGLNDFSRQIFENVTKWKDFTGILDVYKLMKLEERTGGVVCETSGWKVISSPIMHFNGICYRLEVNGKSIVYSGDMAYDEKICEIGKDSDIAILECSAPNKESLKGNHLCPEDIGRLSMLGNFKKIILTHIYPECEGREEEMISTIRDIHNVEVVIAHDFMKIEV